MTAKTEDSSRPYAFFISVWCGSLLALGLLNINHIFSLITGNSDPTGHFVSDTLGASIKRIAEYIDRYPVLWTVVTFLFWLFVGVIVYGILASLFTIAMDAKNEGDQLNYKRPLFQKKSSLLQHILINWAIVLGIGLTLIFCVVIFLSIVFPTTYVLFMSGFYHPNILKAWIYTIGAVSAFAFNITAIIWLAQKFWLTRQLLSQT